MERESLKDESSGALDEARMILPGIQALFGFQLIAVFSDRFHLLAPPLRIAHLAALVLVVIAIALIMAPAAYDRIAERGIVTSHFIELTSRLLTWAMAPLLAAIATDLSVVAIVITGSAVASVSIGAAAALLFGWLWFIVPWRARRRHRGEHAERDR